MDFNPFLRIKKKIMEFWVNKFMYELPTKTVITL